MKSIKTRPIINTPIRTRQNSQQANVPIGVRNQLTPTRLGKENFSAMGQFQPSLLSHQPAVGLSPNKINATRKPSLINKPLAMQYSTVQHQPQSQQPQPQIDITHMQLRKAHSNKSNMLSSRKKECANHPEKQAEFRILIEGEIMLYCYKCSTHLASQGFTVEKIIALKANSSRPSLPSVPANQFMEQSEQANVDPTIVNHPRYLEIVDFIGKVDTVDTQLRKNGEAFRGLSAHYSGQFRLFEQFYDAIIHHMKHIKSEHLNMLKNESRKYIQIGEIESGEIEESLSELESITQDMKTNVNSIVKQVTEDKYRECMNFYSQKIQLSRHRIEEQSTTLLEVTEMSQQELEAKLKEFQNAVNQMFGIKEVTQNNNFNTTVPANLSYGNSVPSNRHAFGNLQKKPTRVQTQRTPASGIPSSNGPFRNLFDEEESLGDGQDLPDQSPQFKNI